jgi:hypothetical protein
MAINYNFRSSFEVFATPEESLQIRKAIIDSIKKELDFDSSSPDQKTTFEWLADNIKEYKREKIVYALAEMEGIEVLESSTGSISIPKSYFD